MASVRALNVARPMRSDATRLQESKHSRVAALCRLIFNFRLIVLLITILSLPNGRVDPLSTSVVLIVAALVSFIPLKYWERVSPLLLRHPAFLACDLLLTMLILTVTGTGNPFFYFTLGTAMLSGVLYGWAGAAVFSPLLLLCYYAGLYLRRSVIPGLDSFQVVVGFPALYPMCAAAGAALKSLLIQQDQTEVALTAAARSTAIERERARIAREMHDSLAKTIHGIGLQSVALQRWIDKDRAKAVEDSRAIAKAAEQAARQARELIQDLRADSPEGSLGEAVAAYVGDWSDRCNVAAAVDIAEVDCSCPEVRWELLRILRESLRNIERHSETEKVRVELSEDGARVVMRVSDEGVGMDVPADLARLAGGGHFGMLGMSERAERVGGTFSISSVPGRGTTVTVAVPSGSKLGGSEQ